MRQKIFPFFLSTVRVLVAYLISTVFFQLFVRSALAEPLPESNTPNPITDLEQVFSNVLSAVAIFAGFACFIMIIVSGFRYLTAQGDPKAIAAAQSSLLWAITGVAFIIIAWIILAFISKFTGIDVTFFRLSV